VNIFFQGHDHLYAKEDIDGMVYQTIPMPSDSSYTLGMIANGDAFGGVKLPGSGHLRVTVSSEKVQVDFVNAVLPKHGTPALKNGDVSYSYTVGATGTVTSTMPPTEKITGMKTWPNPFSDELNIQFDLKKREAVEIRVFDELGNQVYYSKSAIREQGINLIRLKRSEDFQVKPGTYLIQIITSSGIVNQKVICINCR
jgi:hypothetical protein